MSELRALRERVEKAEGPDRELDADIFFALNPEIQELRPHFSAGQVAAIVPELTASIDAAVALIERKLPGYGFEVLASDRDSYRAAVWPWISSRGTRAQIGHQHSYAKTPALALIAALLSALESTNG